MPEHKLFIQNKFVNKAKSVQELLIPRFDPTKLECQKYVVKEEKKVKPKAPPKAAPKTNKDYKAIEESKTKKVVINADLWKSII